MTQLENLKVYSSPESITVAYIDRSTMGSASVSSMGNYFLGWSWFFNRLFVPSDLRGQGVGSLLMEELCKVLDQRQINLVNTVNPYGDLDMEQLISFYGKYGFVKYEREGEPSYDGLLIRLCKGN